MSKSYLKRGALSTTMLVAPALIVLSQPAMANCTGGGAGGLTAPTNGSTVTCDASAPTLLLARQ